MLFESLTLECYGRTERTVLEFPAAPGLAVIFGPNEAGKSSCLEAVSDFLFGVPDRSLRGQIFGADKIRLGATILRADGARLNLRRRKGRIRTLTDANGAAVEDAVLGQMLGATTRERFESLFGLNHATLREGGEHLLKADGDIGRLILEAGGGLRSLVEAVDGLREEAASLFGPRQRSGCLFYDGLAAFKEADAGAKQGLLTRERYDKEQQSLNAARDTLAERRRRLAGLTEERLRLARLVRVVPSIRDLDRVHERLVAFRETEALGEDFVEACRTALDAQRRRDEALEEAATRCKTLEAKIAALALPAAVLDAEAAIRSAGVKATHVEKQRQDRPNREAELAIVSEKLAAMRAALGVATDAELETAAPTQRAIELAQALVTEGLQRQATLAGLDAARRRETAARDDIVVRQAKLRAAGRHEPFGIEASAFAGLPAQEGALAAKRRNSAALEAELDAALAAEGFASFDELAAWPCPDAAVIQCEIERRVAAETSLLRVSEKVEAEREKHDRAEDDIAALTRGDEAPTREAIESARQDRDKIAEAIGARYLGADGGASRPLQDRLADVELHRRRSRAADDLADRRSTEAERIAALDLAQRQKIGAAAALAALALRKRELVEALAAAREAWGRAWREAAARFDDLGRLKRASGERESLLKRRDDWRAETEAATVEAADLAARLDALAHAEARLGLTPIQSLAARVAAVIRAIKAHDEDYGDYRGGVRDAAAAELKLQALAKEYAAEIEAEERWRGQWAPALAALGLAPATELAEANRIATGWAAALAHFGAARQTRMRLKRMDDDAVELAALVKTIEARVEFALPEDAVAAAKMLVERLAAAEKRAVERASLGAQFAERTTERDEAFRLAALARAEVEALCAQGGAAPDTLPALAARCAEHAGAVRELKALVATIGKLGDGLSIEDLRAQWGGRDLDEIQAEAGRLAGDEQELAAARDAALGEQQRLSMEIERLTSEEGVNAAVAAREGAAAQMHDALERHVEIALAEELLREAMERLRDQRKDPLIARAGALFAASTAGGFTGVETEIDHKGAPIVLGRRRGGETVRVAEMSDGARDQLYLAFRIASIESYATAAEPLPFVADDLLVHFDDERSAAALGLLTELGRTTQVLLFTHHRSVREAAVRLAADGRATILDLA